MTDSRRLRKYLPHLLCVLVSTTSGRGQEPVTLADRLNSRLDGETQVEGRDLVHTITRLSARLAVPLGLEITKSPEIVVPFSRSWKDATVRQVIDDVVNAYPTYDAQYEGGVVQIRSKHIRLEQGTSILDLHIDTFTAQDEIVARVSQKLHQLAQKALAGETGEKRTEGSGDAGSLAVGAGGDTKVTFTVEPGPLRSTLNTLVREAKQIWILTYPEKPKVVNGYLETGLVNLTQDIPNERQPAWMIIPYGIEIVSKIE